MRNIKAKLVTAGSALALAGIFSVANPSEASANELNNSWEARTVTEIKQDIQNDDNGSKYTFQWGDTLSSIAAATDISVNSMVKINDINDADMIIAGNSIHLSKDHSQVTVEKNNEVTTYDVSEEEVKEVETPEETKKEITKEEPVEQPAEQPVATQVSTEEPAQPAAEQQSGQTVTVEATAYSTNQPELSDTTYTGINLNENPNVVAVDPSVIPLGSTVVIPGVGTFIAGDTGSAIVGNRIDVHMTDLDAAYQFGRQTLEVQVIN